MQILNFVIGVMLKNEVYQYSLSSNVWLDERDIKIPCLFNRTTLLYSLWLNDKVKRYLRVNILI